MEDTSVLRELYVSSIIQFIISGFLGYGIALITVKHSKDKELMVITLILSVITFLTTDIGLTMIN